MAELLKTFQYIDELVPSVIDCCYKGSAIIKNDMHLINQKCTHERLISAWSLIRNEFFDVEMELLVFCETEWTDFICLILINNYIYKTLFYINLNYNYFIRLNNGVLVGHSFAALCSLLTFIIYEKLDYHDKNIVIYSLIFHCISVDPQTQELSDSFSPFRSTIKTLQIFQKLGWIQNEASVNETISLINSCFIFKEGKITPDYLSIDKVINFLLFTTGLTRSIDEKYSNYYEIIKDLDKSKYFIYEILVLILFQQSINFNSYSKSNNPLTEDQIFRFFSPRLLKLLSLHYLGEFSSHYLDTPQSKWQFQARQNIIQYVLQSKLARYLRIDYPGFNKNNYKFS